MTKRYKLHSSLHLDDKHDSKNTNQNNVFLAKIETIANHIPHPFLMFAYLCLAMMLLSCLLSAINVTVISPLTKETITVKSIISWEGLNYFLTHTLSIITGFRPLGLVFIMVVAIGLAERSGLIHHVLQRLFHRTYGRFLVPVVALIGVVGSFASDSIVFLLPPLAAMIFKAQNRNPIVGIFVAFIASTAGFTASFLISGTDVLLSGISTEVISSIDPNREVSVVANWFFMSASTILVGVIVTLVTHYHLEPKVNALSARYLKDNLNYKSSLDSAEIDENALNDPSFALDNEYDNQRKNKALKVAALSAIVFLVVLVALVVWPGSSLQTPVAGGILPATIDGVRYRSPFFDSIAVIIALFFFISGTAYGFSSGKFTKMADIPENMGEAIKIMSAFFVMIISIAFFIKMLSWSNLSNVIAITGSSALSSSALPPVAILCLFLLLAGFINLFIYSGSAQWALMAPIFLPMLMHLGFEPEAIQAGFRLADSSTNLIAPTNPYLALNIVFIQRYLPTFKMGNLLSLTFPYAGFLFFGWSAFYIAWYVLGIPFGL